MALDFEAKAIRAITHARLPNRQAIIWTTSMPWNKAGEDGNRHRVVLDVLLACSLEKKNTKMRSQR